MIRARLLNGRLADGRLLPEYKDATIKRKLKSGTLYGNGVNYSLKQNGSFHQSIKIVNGVPKAEFKRGLTLLLAKHRISIKDVLG